MSKRSKVRREDTLASHFRHSVQVFANRPALSFVGEEAGSYGQLGHEVGQLSRALQQRGVGKGDRVALLSHNMPNWAKAYFSIVNLGAVAVPMLPDFHKEEIANIIAHAECKAVFVSEALRYKIEDLTDTSLKHTFLLDTLAQLPQQPGQPELSLLPAADDNELPEVDGIEPGDLASIIYTSGTTGKPKGVMLTHRNLVSNTLAGIGVQSIVPTDRFLSVLPLSHAFEFTMGLLTALFSGASTWYLQKPPTPTVLIPALKTVRPTMMFSVPLVIEKIYRNKVLPTFTGSRLMTFLYRRTPLRIVLNRIAGRKLKKTFGGRLKFFGIGGAKLDAQVERFLREARFPYAIGYGLTETSPLLTGANPQQTRYQGTGPAVKGVELKIDNPDPVTGEGEILARGTSIMKGYYREPELTREVFTRDGWFKTGDLGVFDKKGYLHIRGRLKNMIVGASGENIYPEEIESLINNFRYVVESIVVERKGKLVALVHLNMEEMEKKFQHLKEEFHRFEEEVDHHLRELQYYVNSRVNRFSQVQLVLAQPDPFEKTATQKIKRFLYQ